MARGPLVLISAQKHRLWVLVRVEICFEQKYEKYKNFYLIFFSFFDGKIFSIFE